MEFTEGSLLFVFDDRWTVVKYDDHPDYRKKIGKLAETKAVDFVGLVNGDLFWIEVKDFRDYRVENKARLGNGTLVIEVAQKVRDSIAGVVGAYRTSSDAAVWKPFVDALRKKDCNLKILLWLEEDLPRGPRARQNNRAQVLTQQLKTKLRWLTTKVLVGGQRIGGQPEGCHVSNLARN